MIEEILFAVASRSHRGILARPSSGTAPRAAVLLFHGGGGPTEHERQRADMLSAQGYIAFAPDLFGEVFTDRAHGMRVIGEFIAEPRRLRERATAALEWLARVPEVDASRIAAVGHCFGGLAALELARSGAAIRAAVSIHGRLATNQPARRDDVRARVLACTGADDPFCPREQRTAFEDEMTTAGVDWQHHIYGGAKHGFSVPGSDETKQPGCAYHELADRRSWAAMLTLFTQAL